MKKTGKVLSLVLSLALVASSLTATFASARSSEAATITLKDSSIALVNGGVENTTTHTLTSPELATDYLAVAKAELSDHSVVTGLVLKDIAITSGSDKVTLTKTDTAPADGTIDSVKLTLKNKDVSGTVTLKARYEGTVQRGTDEDDTRVYGTADFTATIYQSGKAYIADFNDATDAPADNATTAGADPAVLDKLVKNAYTAGSTVVGTSIQGVVETAAIATGATDATAVWTAQTVGTAAPTTGTDVSYVLSANGAAETSNITIDTDKKYFTLSNNPKTNAKTAPTGNVSILAQGYVGPTASKDRTTARTTVEDKYVAAATDTTISKYSGKTYIGAGEPTSKVDAANTEKFIDVSGSELDLTALTNDVTMTGGKIGDVTTGAAASFIVKDGVVGDIDAKGDVTISGGSVGAVTIADTKTLTINGGAVGDIDGDGEVDITPAASDSPVKTGKISAKVVNIDSADQAAVTTGDIAFVADGSVTLTGDDVKVGKIDADYYDVDLTLDNFKGSISAPSHAYTEGIDSTPQYLTLTVSGEDSNATVTGAASLNAVELLDGASLTFADKVDVGDYGVSGDGVLKFAPNALYTTGDITTSIRLTKAFKAGDVVFTAATDAVDENDFTGVGFTAEKVAASTTKDAFKVKAVDFASLEIQGSAKIPVGTTENYVAATYPEGTTLPEGYYVQWEFSGNSDYLVATADPDDSTKVSVKAVKEDKTFTSLNKGTLTATVVDVDGFEDYKYAPATFDVSIGAKPSAYTSDTHGTYNMLLGQSYTFKITASDGSVPPFVVANDGAKVAPYTKSGNDYLFKVTGAKVGDYGVYVGDKVCILHITDVKTDTTKVTVANGKSYVFKITKGEAASAPYFVVAGQGVVLPVDVRGNDYFYKVTNNGRTGDVGVYVNGPKIAVITFTK